MRKACLIALLLSAAVAAYGQADRDLVQKALEQAQIERKDTSKHKLYHLFRDQMRGQCYYAPECVEFFPQAVKELGPIRGTLSTLDRLTRCTYIGTATFPRELRGKDGRIHEGTEAYRRRRKEK
ncbi:MAG: membrane protein insertion efficiency factor YidD [Bacteroidales bacterium]|nr:membrane protein insertion efficiency factor YidD [Bacteroidales bacterium]